MKFASLLLLVSLVWVSMAMAQPSQQIVPPDQAADGVYRIVEKGAHQRTWQRITQALDENGFLAEPSTNSYVEIATGMHRWAQDKNEWVDASDEIEILENGAVARQSQHQVFFNGNLNDKNGTVDLVTPDSKHMRSQILGLAYSELDTHKTILIAQIKDCQGAILGTNQVLYSDALDSFGADVRYTTTRGAFEQDVIIRAGEELPNPVDSGFKPETTQLQVWTEFLEAPQPQKQTRAISRSGGLVDTDETLNFGQMYIYGGAAFTGIDADVVPGAVPAGSIQAAAVWQIIEGRTFLIESVPYLEVREKLNALLRQGANLKHATKQSQLVNKRSHLQIPGSLSTASSRRKGGPSLKMLLAQAREPSPGVILDYYQINGTLTNVTFRGDVTYFISSATSLYQNTTIEGGTIIKYGRFPAYIGLYGPLKCLTGPYRPALLTAKDDNSIGESVTTNVVSGVYSVAAFSVNNNESFNSFHDLHVRYLSRAIHLATSSNEIRNCQFLDLRNGIYFGNNTTNNSVRNVLMTRFAEQALWNDSPSVVAEHLTLDGFSVAFLGNTNNFYGLTNCLFVCVTNFNLAFSGSNNATNNDPNAVFQTVGAGAHYLVANSPYRNAGTTAISSQLLSELTIKTTYPPIDLGGTITTSTLLSPQTQRDTDTPDIGFHYDPLDYLISNVGLTNASLTLTNGVAVGLYGTIGIQLYEGGSVISEGSPVKLNRLVRYRTVQESSILTSEPYSYSIYCSGSYSPAPELRLRFTELSLLPSSNVSAHVYSPSSGAMLVSLRDCLMRGGSLLANNSGSLTLDVGNCLMERVNSTFQGATVTLYNNTFFGGTLGMSAATGQSYTVKDNLFDQTSISNLTAGTWSQGYNGYVTNYTRLSPNGTGDVILAGSPAFQTGTLGSYYLPSASTLTNAGSRIAPDAGLYHYTTQTTQTKETTSMVDIGFHYVALDGNGNPDDDDSDGVPDYLEDRNGNGTTESDETNWQDATDLGLKVFITEPKGNANVP